MHRCSDTTVKLRDSRGTPILLVLAAFLWPSLPAWAWGCKGHQTVALLAEQQLTPEALEFVNQLLAGNPVDSGLPRDCADPAHDLLADASTWPDEVRNSAKNGPWHYIDIPRGAARAPLSEYCGRQGCVTKAIADQVALLKNPNADAHLRADAIRYLVHFVADLHMPLHASSNDDRGGNCVPVYYFWRRPRTVHGSFTPNLHSLWDVTILELDMNGADPAEYAAFLSETFASDFAKWREAGMHLDDWAWESHDVAEAVVYGRLSPPVPIEKAVQVHSCADDNNIGQRMMDLHFSAGESYQQVAVPVVRKRLAQAAVRLALILNDAAAATKRTSVD
jgi:hypothetical protein